MTSDSAILREHGTEFMRLKCNNIVQAACADLRLRERKRAKQASPETLYSFARRHVHRADDPAYLIALAYFDPKPAANTDKHSTLVVYGDRDLLRETLIGLLDGSVECPADWNGGEPNERV